MHLSALDAPDDLRVDRKKHHDQDRHDEHHGDHFQERVRRLTTIPETAKKHGEKSSRGRRQKANAGEARAAPAFGSKKLELAGSLAAGGAGGAGGGADRVWKC